MDHEEDLNNDDEVAPHVAELRRFLEGRFTGEQVSHAYGSFRINAFAYRWASIWTARRGIASASIQSQFSAGRRRTRALPDRGTLLSFVQVTPPASSRSKVKGGGFDLQEGGRRIPS